MNAALLALAFVVQDTVVLKPVVVTATRFPVPVDIVASAVTVIGGVELRAQGVRSIAEALRQVPGVAVVETGSFGGQTSLFLRGGESDYVKVLLDGVPLNQPGGGLDLADLTTDNVDRIEVVRGPASVLYGSDAMTGVIQIFTRTGQGAPRVGAELRAGTYGTTEGAVEIGGGARAVSYSARASRFGSDGLYPYNNQYRNAVVSARVRVAPDARTDASLSYRYGDKAYHVPTDFQGQPTDSNAVGTERGPALSLSLGRSLGARVDVRVLATLREARLAFSNEPDSPGEMGAFHSHDYVRRASGGALVTWRLRDGSIVTAGVDYEDERQRGASDFDGFANPPVSVGRWNTGYYAQTLLGTAGPVAVTLGTRVDDNSQFGGHATFRAGATWRLDANTRFRATIGTGFKEPTFFENFASGFVRGNPHLDPERSRSWEAGLEHTIPGARVSFAVTYFDQRFRDLIEFTLTPPPPDSVNYFNVEGASADGVEAVVSATVAPGVAVDVRYTYLDTRVEEAGLDGGADGLFVAGQPLLRRPAHTVAPQLAATLGDRARVIVGARWVGERDDLDFRRPAGNRRVTLPPYTRVNLAAEYDLRPFVLTARLENAFNDGTPEPAGFRSRGRTILVGGRVALGS
jgi:vitamin B12 transporter